MCVCMYEIKINKPITKTKPSNCMLPGLQKAIKGATCFCVPSASTAG